MLKVAVPSIALIPFIIFLIVCLIEWQSPFSIDLNMNQWIMLFGAFLTYIGTCSLGVLALWQNQKANDINDKLVTLEREKTIPGIYLRAINNDEINYKNRMCIAVLSELNELYDDMGIYLIIGNSKSEKVVFSSVKSVRLGSKTYETPTTFNSSLNSNEEKTLYLKLFCSKDEIDKYCEIGAATELVFDIELVNTKSERYRQEVNITIIIYGYFYVANIIDYKLSEPKKMELPWDAVADDINKTTGRSKQKGKRIRQSSVGQ